MQLNRLDDTQLVRQYISGEESAFEVLLKRHKDRVFNYVRMTVRDRQLAEDIFQETFCKAIITLKAGKYNDEGKFLPWIMRIAHNLIIDSYRRNAKMPSVEPKNEDHDIFASLNVFDKNVETEMIEGQIVADLRKLITHLPEEQREVIVMRHYEDLSFKEIADKTNVSINTALGRMRYALINLRKMIEENQIVLSE
jgi:RNA polymerase sigma-70 factor (ECF subfamily)